MKKTIKKIKLKKEDISHLAKLAGVMITEIEKEKTHSQLVETLQYVENINELDTEKVNETTSPIFQNNIFFTDGAINERGLKEDEVFANAKKRKNNFFVTKKIL